MLGVPVVVEPAETVELIQKDNNYLVIATDKSVYKFNKEATATVSVGDTVYAGDWLVDTVQIYELNTGTVPDVLSVSAGLGFLPGGFSDGIGFSNKDVPLVVETVDGKTKVSFELGGLPTDVELFWELTHQRGLASGKTLANYLDVRENPTDEPGAASLPATVNPLQFLVENVLRYNAFVVKIKVSAISGNVISKLVRKITPPWTACILLLDIDIDDPEVLLEAAASETAPGYSESVSSFVGAEPQDETISGEDYLVEKVSIRLVNGVCR
jgi:hypothetical protein